MIDILLATYNGERFLREQIDSILGQTYKDWRLLIRDDGSTDRTVEIVKSYIAKYPDEIRLLEDNLGNLGSGQNFGVLLSNSTADYAMFADQDDVWLPDKVEVTLKKMTHAEKDFPDTPILVFTNFKLVDENLNVITESVWSYHKMDTQKGVLLKNLTYCPMVAGCTIMINKKLRDISVPLPKYALMHDWWVALNAAKYGKIFAISTPTLLHIEHAKNVVGATKKNMTPSLFMKRLRRFLREGGKNYKVIKQFDPNANPVKYLWKCLQNSIRARINR